ncbi:unnamed protein product [Prorocentrum cordatum]|uniref:Uncharacterized protein n=1 Tax=Prorocentrum cordatum TaxID=2364126 RepID=A0ABN9W4A3_9DINO|nr:unnamed protein product [Polarella glacialis]
MIDGLILEQQQQQQEEPSRRWCGAAARGGEQALPRSPATAAPCLPPRRAKSQVWRGPTIITACLPLGLDLGPASRSRQAEKKQMEGQARVTLDQPHDGASKRNLPET